MALTGAVTEIAALEEAYEESTKEGGKPTRAQVKFLREVEVLYIQREGIDLVYEIQDEPVMTPTDVVDGAADGPSTDAE